MKAGRAAWAICALACLLLRPGSAQAPAPASSAPASTSDATPSPPVARGAAPAIAAPGVEDLEVYCPGARQDLPDVFDLEAHFVWAAKDETAESPDALAHTCRAWAWAERHGSAGEAAEAQATVAGALVWLQRNDQALPLLSDAFVRLRNAKPARLGAAATAATFLSIVHYQRGDGGAALQWSQQGVDLATRPDAGLPPLTVLRIQANHVAFLSNNRRFAEAESLATRLLAIAREALPASALEYGGLLRSRAMSQRRQDKIPEALDTTRQEIAFRQTQPTLAASDFAVAWQNLGTMLESRGLYDEAQQALREAAAAAEAGGPDIFRTLSSIPETLSRLLLLRGQAVEALVEAQRAVSMLEGSDASGRPRMARPLRHLAMAQLATGSPGAALISVRRALALLATVPALGDLDSEAALHAVHAQLQLALGDTAQAQAALADAQTRLRTVPLAPTERARLQVLGASLAQRRGETREALRALDETDLTLAALGRDGDLPRLALQVQACDWGGRGCAEVQAARDAIASAPLRAQATLALARHAGSDETGLTLGAEAIADALAASQPDVLWQAYSAYAVALHRGGRRDEAIFFGKQALQTLEGLRDSVRLLGTGSEATYLQDKHLEYRRVADWLLDAGRLPEAVEVLRLLKRSEQSDFTERAAPLAPGTTLGYTAREQRWLQRVMAEAEQDRDTAAETERLARLEAARRTTPDEARRLQALRAASLQQAAANRARWSLSLQALASVGAAAAASPLDAAPRLPLPRDADTLHVYLLAGPERLSALLVGQRGRRVLHQPVGSAELGRGVAALLDAVRQRGNVLLPAQALYRHLGPLLDEPARAWGQRRIVLWLDGPLRYLPPALLHDGRQFLVERYTFEVATPVDAVVAEGVAAAPRPLRVRAWGVTQSLAGLPALPGVGEEMCGIVDGPLRGMAEYPAVGRNPARCQGALAGRGDANAEFTEAAWRASAGVDAPGGVVHVGTHFVLRPGNVSQSWLLLGDGSRLMLKALREWPLGTPRLLTLSACETAVPAGVDADGREIDGLAATLLAAGARQVLASVWRIDDRATAGLMQRFYRLAAQRPDDLPGALQRAQVDAMRRGLPPQAWAAFTLSAPAPR